MKRFFLLILVFTLVTGIPIPVYAEGVVGNGTPGSCTETTLEEALTDGGNITFNCGGAKTIIFSNQKIINIDTMIDGGGLITLSGGNSTRLFEVNSGVNLTVKNLYLSNGVSLEGDGGAILNNGNLVVENSNFQNNQTPYNRMGGAIASYGSMTITKSIIANNTAGDGGALYIHSSLTNTKINILNSSLQNNSTNYLGDGGAIFVSGGVTVTIQATELFNNIANSGGGINILSGTVMMNNSILRGNTASYSGGGINIISGVAIVDNSILNENMAHSSGGGIYNDDNGVVELTNCTLEHNSGGDGISWGGNGGGISNQGYMDLNNVTVSNNIAKVIIDGSKFYGGIGGGMYTSGYIRLINVTISGNSADLRGGGINQLGYDLDASLLLINSTLFENYPDGIYCSNCGQNSVGISNTIISSAIEGSNCKGGAIGSFGYNISSDDTCNFYSLGDQRDVDPLLGPLTFNGGPTLTHLPLANSPAIDKGGGLKCPVTDQRGAIRPQGVACDVGSVEYGALLPWVFLPTILR